MTEPSDLRANIGTNLTANLEIAENLKQEVVMTTRDKIKVALHEMLPRYAATEQLLASLGLFLGLITPLMTADFRDVWGIPGSTITGGFAVCAAGAGVWAARELWRWCRRPSLDDLVERIVSDAATRGGPGARTP